MSIYKALFLDIDGTIVRPDNTMEESTKRAVAQAKEKGIISVLTTGRPIHEISNIAEELSISSFIGYNGAYAVHQGIDVYKSPLPRDIVEYILETSQRYDHELVLYTSEKNLYTSQESPRTRKFIEKLHLTMNEDYNPSEADNILGITIMAGSAEDFSLYEIDQTHLSQVNVDGLLHCFDVIRDEANKGIGMRKFLEHLGFPPESSIAFGDGMNDKEMLAAAGESFAMGNAHSDLFAYAKHKTTDVNHSGVYNGLKYLGIAE
nr:HAD family hydrolase [Peribacillus kribbensis]